mmetsp:Transcript_5220/g.2980  ORF Transcript_5220/g.2980 Transcript_5220/m.2980 type:complete len:180 (-) Transcript_5220:2238-2777(-)
MLQIENTALIVIDVQGKLAQLMYEKDSLFESLQKIIEGSRLLELPIIWMEQIPEKLGPTISVVSNLMQDIQPISKSSFSCCGNEKFSDALNKLNRKQLLLVGIETHICIYQTSIDLLKLGYEVHIVTDAVSSRTLANKQIGLEKIKDAGGNLTSTETVFFELLKIAEGKKFGEIVKIVK